MEKQIDEMTRITCPAYHRNKEKKCGGFNECDMKCLQYKRSEALYNAGYRKIPDNIGEFSDGYHTFNELYHHRAILFSVICNMFPEKAWKSKMHDTGDMYDGMFIVGIETEQGQATYHYDIEPYWNMFKVKELEKAPKWDGHTPADVIERISNLSAEGQWIVTENGCVITCSECGYRLELCYPDGTEVRSLPACPNCGTKMKGGS